MPEKLNLVKGLSKPFEHLTQKETTDLFLSFLSYSLYLLYPQRYEPQTFEAAYKKVDKAQILTVISFDVICKANIKYREAK